MFNHRRTNWLFVLLPILLATPALAQTTYEDNFMYGQAQLDWKALGHACLTAGDDSGSIPACDGISQNSGKGALRLTPARNSKAGAILSNFTFPMSQGLQVTFTTYSYGSTSNGPPAHIGADGIVFFLTDGTKPVPSDTGATGGAMGYSCSYTNTGRGKKWNGIEHGYLGLGMDEWGNFLNNGDNGGDGASNTNADGAPSGHGGNSWSNHVDDSPGDSRGRNYQPNRIGMRGAGNVNFKWLHEQNPYYYSKGHPERIAYACHNGKYLTKEGDWKHLKYDYYVIPDAYKALPKSQPLADVDAKTRIDGWPVTYKVTISSSGMLNFSYSYNNGSFTPVLTNKDISSINGTPPEKFRFGFSAGTGGQNNIHEITCFKASPLRANSSAAANTQEQGKVTGHTQFFLASYSTNNWWGSLVADPLITDENGDLAISVQANWDAKCMLTGGECATMGIDPDTNNAPTITRQAPADRVLLTSSDKGADKGVVLKWDKLGTDEKDALNDGSNDADNGADRVKWLRGVRSVEQLHSPTPGTLRARTFVLGDIINSSPVFVGQPVTNTYPNQFADFLHSDVTVPENAGGATTYSSFAATHAGRENVVYVGSNDGFLHGFRAGGYTKDASTNAYVYDASTNDGKEVIGYMPYGVLTNKAVDLADPLYEHDYLVDATPTAGDVFYGKAWHTWLIGGVGSDGKEIYALDITDPDNFTESNAASLVIGDWTGDELANLGNTVGRPIIQRMHNGDWAFIFGSGLGSGKPEGIYIGLIDSGDGSVSFKFLGTGVTATDSAAPGGISEVSAVDLDGDHIADYLYAADTSGNVWRFDVTSNDAGEWSAGSSAVFTARDGAGNAQPITTAITVLAVKTGLVYRVMLYFGTGQQVQQTGTSGRKYATGQQTFYGVWDADMAWWNQHSNVDYAAIDDVSTLTRSSLAAQNVQSTVNGGQGEDIKGYRMMSTNEVVCWKGATNDKCTVQDKYGWLFDLPGQGPTNGANEGANEQVIYSPVFAGGAVVVNTAIPPIISAYQCNPGLQTGWTMTFNPKTGAGMAESFFPDPGNGGSDDNDGGDDNGGSGDNGDGNGDTSVGGVKAGGVGSVTVIQHGDRTYLGMQTVTGTGVLLPVNPASENHPARVSWREMVNQ